MNYYFLLKLLSGPYDIVLFDAEKTHFSLKLKHLLVKGISFISTVTLINDNFG